MGPDPRTLAVYAQDEALVKQIGLPLPHHGSAGGHRLEEHLLVDSLVSHGRLLAGLIATLTP